MSHVVKRNGAKERLDLDKLHKVVFWAVEGISGVSASEIEIRSKIQFYDNIETKNIQETLIRAAADLISEETPNYQTVAGRLINYHLRKEVYGQYQPIPLIDLIKRNVKAGFYDPALLTDYTEEEWAEIDNFVDHERDMLFPYVAMEQIRGKYLVQNRVTKQLMETPQVAYALIAAVSVSTYPAETRISYVKEVYDSLSLHAISAATPVMAGVRTTDRQYSSCVLIESADSRKSITATVSAIVEYVSQKAGIGIGGGSIRPLGSPVRNGATTSSGVIPFYKLFQAAVKSCSQGSIRNGAATLFYPIWHLEVSDMLVLKNNKGTEDNRIRHMDYGVQFNKTMYERLLSGKDITLFDPHDLPEMYNAFFNDQPLFRKLYEAAEANPKLRKKAIKAIDLFSSFMQERKDTGRLYSMNVDNANTHSSFDEALDPIHQSNLCIAGDSLVDILDSHGDQRTVPLEEVGFYMLSGPVKVRSRNQQTRKEEFAIVSAFAKTSDQARVMKITDPATGNFVICTPEHRVFTTNRGEVRAADLKTTDTVATVECGWNLGRKVYD